MKKYLITSLFVIIFFVCFSNNLINAQANTCECKRGTTSVHGSIPPLEVSTNNCQSGSQPTCSTDWNGQIIELPNENISCSCKSTNPTPPLFVICDAVKDDQQKQQCSSCLSDNGVWTALGCLHYNPKNFITDFLKIAMGIAGGIALLLMVYGSFLISTSAGDPKKAEEGKEIITGTIAGLLFIIFSVFLLRLIGVDILNIPGL